MLRLTSLGRLELLAESAPLLSGRRKLLSVLVYLARATQPVPRARLAELFWPVEDEVRARRSVRQALTELRRAVGGALQELDDAVGIAEGSLDLDASLFESAVTHGKFQQAVDLWGGEFLTGLEDIGGEDLRTWLEAERQGLRSRFAFVAEALVDAAERRGAWDSGLALTARWSELFPYDERANLRHGQLLALAGRRAEAGARHLAFIERLRREMGQEPSTESVQFATAMRAGGGSAGRDATPDGRALFSPDLIARETGFSTLTRLWESVQRGAPALALIEGEEGLGKSRLIEDFLLWLVQRAPTAVVLRARAFEAERERTGVLARHLLAPLATAPGVAASPAAALRALAALVPEVAERFPVLPSDGSIMLLSDAVARVLADAAAECPVVLAVDDAHLADPESLELLEGLWRRPVAGVLVLLSALPEGLQVRAELERRGEDMGAVIRLRALAVEEIERLLASMAEFVPGDLKVLGPRLHAESGGNPLAVVELLTSLAAQGTVGPGPDGRWMIRTLGDAPLPIPSSLREAMVARLGHLAPDAARVLEAAAVLGRESELDLVRELTGLDPSRLEDAIDQAVGQRLLRLAGDGSTRLEFIHEAARRVVYQELAPLRRRDLHRRTHRMLRRRPARDSTQQAVVEHHRMRAGAIPGPRRYLKWALITGVVALALSAMSFLRRRNPTPVSPTAIAVLPFEVRQDGQYAYLGEGMVDLLSADLDGLGGLRSVDPNALLTQVSRTPAGARDPARGKSVAALMGAGLYVLGDITDAGGRVQIVAYLYDAQGRLQTVARANAESEAGIHRAVDEIARQLLAGRHEGPAEGLTRLAVATTASVPALKAYLEGERRLREGAFGPAVEAFQTAIAADTTFALAYYRLAVAAEWDERSELSEFAAEQAARFGGRLSGHNALLVSGLLAWRRGDAVRAESIYTQIVRDHRQDLEAWFQLGEVLFHANPLRGRSIELARAAWEWVFWLDPGNRFAMLHLARIAAAQDDSASLIALLQPMSSSEPNGDRRVLELAAWRALVLRDLADEQRVSAQLRRSGHHILQNVIWQLATWSRNLAGSERLARLMLDQKRDDEGGHLILAHLALARGRWRQAQADLPTGQVADEPLMLSVHAYLASHPFLPVSRSELLRLRRELTAWRPRAIPGRADGPDVTSLHGAVAPLLREYLLGTLSVRLSDQAGAARSAASLERAQTSTAADSFAQALALGVRALAARSQGHPEAALHLLERIRRPARREEVSQSPFHASALERYLRADLLRELGREEEALGWYASLGELSPFELIYLGPSHLHQAEIYQRLNRPIEAAEHYARFIDLWQDADPELQPEVAAARARLKELKP